MIPFKDNVLWWGIVENVFDPLEQGRVQVRIVGAHTENRSLLPTDDLPWAEIMMPVTSAGISGVGFAPVGLVNGSTVAGIFKDGDDKQEPIVMWSAGGRASRFINQQFGFNDPEGFYPKGGQEAGHDTNLLARGIYNNESTQAFESSRVTSDDAQVDPGAPKPSENPAMDSKAPWMPFAIGERGVSEESNAARVREYHKVGNGTAFGEDVPWCAGFVGWCLVQAGYKSSRSAMARSYSNYGTKVTADKVPYGTIGVLRGTRGPSSGHVVFVMEDNGAKLKCIGGNQTTDEGKKFDTGGRVTIVNFSRDKFVSFTFPDSNDKKA